MRQVSRAALLAPLLLVNPETTSSAVQTQDPVFSSTARACVMHDYGTPRPASTTLSDDALWPNEHGLLAEASDGNLYSTSPGGGTANSPHGTIVRFRVSDRTFSVLYTFDGKHGSTPHGGLTAGRRPDGTFDGYLYGTTRTGGFFGTGTIFRLKLGDTRPDTIHNFRNQNMAGWYPPGCPVKPCPYTPKQRLDAAGGYPMTAPVMAADGNLYGVTPISSNQAYGVLYRIGPAGGYQAICIFNPTLLGDRAMASLVCDPGITEAKSLIVGDGGQTLYGTTWGGYGAIWRAGLGGGPVTVLHRFGLISGALPQGSKPTRIIQGRDGWLYGTTLAGGSVGAGVLFRQHKSGPPFTVLTDFPIRPDRVSTAINPIAGLVEKIERLPETPWREDTMLYGAGRYGGTGGRGSIFPIGANGTGLKLVHSFPNRWTETGSSPLGQLLVHSDSSIYGTAYVGGMYNKGTMYRVTGTTLADLQEASVVPKLSLPAVATDITGKPVKDDLVEVRTEVAAYQTATNGVINYVGRRGIRFDVTRKCRTPHLVQFIYREEIMSTNPPVWRTGRRPQGYDLTTNPAAPDWDTDTGHSLPPNPYFDQVLRNAVITDVRFPSHPSALTVWDQPSMGPTDTTKLTTGDTRRATFATFLICNCELVRRIDWKREFPGSGDTLYTITSLTPVTAADVKWVNDLLTAQKFSPVK